MDEEVQANGTGRDPGKSANRPGRSRWPEVESIRELTQQQRKLGNRPDDWHPKDARIPTRYFPRAEFGMPIIVELRGEHLPNKKDNLKPTIQPNKKTDRMASPVIVRPLCFADGKATAMILVLDKKWDGSVYLKPGAQDLEHGIPIPAGQVTNSQLAHYVDSPLDAPDAPGNPPRSAKGSALEAFLAFAQERDFREVKA